jgi:predicted secreted protein
LTLLLMATGDQMALAQSPPPAVTVTGNGSGGAQARVRVGQELDIRLSANPTTGYVWRYRPDPPPLLRLGARRFEPSAPHTPPLLGLGGVQVFTFEATAAGTVALRFEYRKGEAGEPVRSFGLDITVLP